MNTTILSSESLYVIMSYSRGCSAFADFDHVYVDKGMAEKECAEFQKFSEDNPYSTRYEVSTLGDAISIVRRDAKLDGELSVKSL